MSNEEKPNEQEKDIDKIQELIIKKNQEKKVEAIQAEPTEPVETVVSAEKEIEIGLDVKRSSTPIPENASIPGESTNTAQDNIAELGSDMTTDELLRAIASSPTELLIPWEDVQLPSRGLFYEGWTNGVVRVRAMTQNDEKVFANRRLIQSGQALDHLFNNCVEFPTNIDPADLLVGDRTFLLYYIRGVTFGNMYEFQMTCPNEACQVISTHSYNMNELYQTVIYADESLGSEPFKVVKFNKRASNTVRAGNVRRGGNRKNQPESVESNRAEAILESSLAKSIVCFNNNSDPVIIRQLTQKLHAADNAAIRQFLMTNSPGIDTTVTIICPECSNEVTIELPITDGFFRSAKSSTA